MQLSKSKKDNSIALAIVDGGKQDGDIIYFNEDNNKANLHIENLFDYVKESDIKKHKKYMKNEELLKIQRAFENDSDIDEDDLKEIYDKIKDDVYDNAKKSIKIHDGVLRPLPLIPTGKNENQIDTIFISGKNGSGKSYLIARYVELYLKMYPTQKVYLFSAKKEDKSYEGLKIKKIKITDDLLGYTDYVKDFKDSLVIFDDTESIHDKEINKIVRDIRNEMLECSRDQNTFIIVVDHMSLNYRNTRNLPNECTKVVFYPNSGRYQITRYLKQYAGIEPQTIKKIMSTSSRWVMLNTNTIPNTIITEHEIFII